VKDLLAFPLSISLSFPFFHTIMTLRLSTTNSNSIGNPLLTLEHDVNVSNAAKKELFQFLSIVVKNLIEKTSPDEKNKKYRQLRLSNPKIQRLTSTHPSVMEFLTHTIGFRSVVIANEPYLEYNPDDGTTNRLESLESWRSQILSTLERVRPAMISHSSSSSSLGGGNTSSSSSSMEMMNAAQLSEKQKARRLLEQKLLQEKEAEKMARKRTVSQIAADKHVRENDPNWKPSVAAAAAKAGDNAISTFRDKYGET
jgi:hypothetical protein